MFKTTIDGLAALTGTQPAMFDSSRLGDCERMPTEKGIGRMISWVSR
jgi:hypothetical protein